jgi:hypothetical protein
MMKAVLTMTKRGLAMTQRASEDFRQVYDRFTPCSHPLQFVGEIACKRETLKFVARLALSNQAFKWQVLSNPAVSSTRGSRRRWQGTRKHMPVLPGFTVEREHNARRQLP